MVYIIYLLPETHKFCNEYILYFRKPKQNPCSKLRKYGELRGFLNFFENISNNKYLRNFRIYSRIEKIIRFTRG